MDTNNETKLIEQALQICRAKLPVALERKAEAHAEVEHLERKIKNLESLLAPPSDSARTALKASLNREKAARGRMGHNRTEPMFIECLQAAKTNGVTLQTLIGKTGTSVATAYRVIRKLERENKAERRGKEPEWYWKGTNS
jgi:hypothetical protein